MDKIQQGKLRNDNWGGGEIREGGVERSGRGRDKMRLPEKATSLFPFKLVMEQETSSRYQHRKRKRETAIIPSIG